MKKYFVIEIFYGKKLVVKAVSYYIKEENASHESHLILLKRPKASRENEVISGLGECVQYSECVQFCLSCSACMHFSSWKSPSTKRQNKS